MKACGIVAEFNPLHKGHEYIMKEARRLTDCDALVVAISGNYVQRGEPAITDKWARSKAALLCGADLIIEIPVLFCLSDAGRYAASGVKLLESLGCVSNICCGSGSGDENTLRIIAELIRDNREEISERISELLPSGMSYPAAREQVVKDLAAARSLDVVTDEVMNNPNDVLALEYMISASKSEVNIIKRIGSDYDAEFDSGSEIQSAGGIRDHIKENGIDAALTELENFMPACSADVLRKSLLTSPEDWSGILRYAILSSTPEKIDRCPSGGEGLGNLLKKAATECKTWDEIVKYSKSKRYTYSRISRLCMQVILSTERESADKSPSYIRLLGFNEKGREFLSYIKDSEFNSLPVITNINKESSSLDSVAAEMLADEIRYNDIYNAVTGRDSSAYSDHIRRPVTVE